MNCIRRFESEARAYFRRMVDDFPRQSNNFAHRFSEETIELIEKRSVAVAHRLDPAFQTGKVADHEHVRWGQPSCDHVNEMWHMLYQVNQRRGVDINYQG